MAGSDMVMTPAVWTRGYAALMFAMWWVMMVAMMLPSAAPMLLIFARVSRREQAAGGPGADRHLRRRLSLRLGRVQRGGGRAAVGAGDGRAAIADDGDDQPLAGRRLSDRRRLVAAHADQARVPSPLPLAGRLPFRSLARWPLAARCAWAWSTAPIAWAAAGS